MRLAYAIDNVFLLFICAVLVLFMQAGFAMVDGRLQRQSKHTVNILFKNALDLCVGVLLYFVVGYQPDVSRRRRRWPTAERRPPIGDELPSGRSA